MCFKTENDLSHSLKEDFTIQAITAKNPGYYWISKLISLNEKSENSIISCRPGP